MFAIVPASSPDDLAATAGLFRQYAASLSIDLAYQDFETELATLPGRYAPPQGRLLLARDPSGTAIGCVALRPMDQDDRCEIKRLFVSPSGRGTGLGSALVDAVIAEAARIGYREMRLDTLPEMASAQALYRRAGFAVIAPYYDTPVAGTIFMGLTLPPFRSP